MTEKAKLVDQTGRNSLDPKHAPVPLPAGSFDLDHLSSALRSAATGAADKRDDHVATALTKAAGDGTQLEGYDPAGQPGFDVREVKHDVLDITENVRVFDPKLVDAAATTAKE